MAEEKYISGEEYQALKHGKNSHQSGAQITFETRWLGLAAAVVILCGLSFWAGTAYQKDHTNSTTAPNGSNGGFGGKFRGAGRSGGFGQVTAVSSTSVSVQNQRTGMTTTYTITGSTTITDNGQTISASDIQTGDTVVVMTAGSGSATATSIVVNPNFGGGGGGFGGTSQITSGTPGTTQTN